MKWNKIFMLVFVTLLASTMACEELEETPNFSGASVSALTLTTSTTSIVLNSDNTSTSVVSCTWNDPGYSIGLKRTKFTIYFDKKDNNFANPSTIVVTGALTTDITGAEINGIAFKYLDSGATSVQIETKVVGSLENNSAAVASNVVTLTVTPINTFTINSEVKTIVLDVKTADDEAITFDWTNGFPGFSGVVTYDIEAAKGGTEFAMPLSNKVTDTKITYSHADLNKLALGVGILPLQSGTIDFRMKATNERSLAVYSSTHSLTVTPYTAYVSIGIIGSATAGGWDTDTDMYRPDEANDPVSWETTLYLKAGDCKFRTDDDWAVNWGDTEFPSGIGTSGGPNIPISTIGYYRVTFNTATGAYTFSANSLPTISTLALTGDQFGWGTGDFQLTRDMTDPNIFTGKTTLEGNKDVKFRADGQWNDDWGGSTFPSGYGGYKGSNIKVTTGGEYFIYINIGTGEYFFGSSATSMPYTSVGIIGDATANGWASDTGLIKNPSMPYRYSATVELTAKDAKFRANGAWDVSWGSLDFPKGIGSIDNGPNIKIAEAETYVVSFHSGTGEYNFLKK